MSRPRSSHGAAAFHGKIVVVGGLDEYDKTLRSCEAYDPLTDQWSPVASLPEGRGAPAVGVLRGALCVVGGDVRIHRRAGRARPASMLRYDDCNDAWVVVPVSDPLEFSYNSSTCFV